MLFHDQASVHERLEVVGADVLAHDTRCLRSLEQGLAGVVEALFGGGERWPELVGECIPPR
jgi:hypothetical protein